MSLPGRPQPPPMTAEAARRAANFDDAKAGGAPLPDPLVACDGTTVESADAWWQRRRPEILRLFEQHVYGRTPRRPREIARVERVAVHAGILDGMAVAKEVDLVFAAAPDAPRMRLLLVLPTRAKRPVPCFLGLNFLGNAAICDEPSISPGPGSADPDMLAKLRGKEAGRWPLESILARGYAVATAHYEDLDPDFDDGFRNGIHPLFYRPGQDRPDEDEWGAIGAWAWGLSRALDYLEGEPGVDAGKVAVIGHSRLGKAALWAGAQDPRFALVVSNDSGCGGAALSRRNFGETVGLVNARFPHWFCRRFHGYGGREASLPVDQHQLLALVAPRPLYVASASEDLWADPRGEFLAALHASPVYRLLGAEGLPLRDFPAPGEGAAGALGYHLRPGAHDLLAYDWQRYLDFADRHLRGA